MSDERENLAYEHFGTAVRDLARAVAEDDFAPDMILSIARGGLFVAGGLGYALDVKNLHVVNVEFYTGGSSWGEELAEALDEADTIVDDAEREAAYQDINRKLMSEYLPAVPLTHSPPAMVVRPEVEGLIPSPLTKEEFATVTISE